MRSFFAFVLAVGSMTGAIAADFSFGPLEFIKFDNSPAANVAIGDVTGDGRDDMIVLSGFGNEATEPYGIYVYSQTSAGSFALPLKYSYVPEDSSPLNVSITLADIDRNGILDIIVGRDGGITTFASNGVNGFVRKFIPHYWSIFSTVVVDVDGDGLTDIAGATPEGVLVHYLDAAGNVRSSSLLGTAPGFHLKAGDVNNDGLPDLVLSDDDTIWVYKHAPGSGFLPSVSYEDLGGDSAAYRGVVIADLNRDGLNDVAAVSSAWGESSNNNVWIHFQQPNGELGLGQPSPTMGWVLGLTAADLDRNGYADIVVTHESAQPITYFLQTPVTLRPEQELSAMHGVAGQLGLGDFDSDGCTDAAYAAMSPSLVAMYRGRNCYEPWKIANQHDGDFDGDGRTDILWRHKVNGRNVIWKGGNSGNPLSLLTVARAWQIAGIGDFDADGRSDIVWRHSISGANTIWRAANSSNLQSMTGITDLNWQIVGIGDFDGDSRSDVLWRHKFSGQNAIWKAGRFDNQMPTIALSPNWWTAGVGDFDGDGRADILWRNTVNGQNVLWKAGNYLTPRTLTAVNDLYWQVAGIGDFDADSRADILWRHSITGAGTIWKAANSSSQRSITRITTMVWNIAGVGDFDGNGRSDILWRNRRTGVNTAWKAANSTTQQPVGTLNDMSWEIAR